MVLLCPEDGQQRLVEVAVCVCEAVLGGRERLEQVDTDSLATRMTGKQPWLKSLGFRTFGNYTVYVGRQLSDFPIVCLVQEQGREEPGIVHHFDRNFN